MITVKLLGGAKKSFVTDIIKINENNITIQKLLNILLEKKPKDTPDLDLNNTLVAVNGVEYSVLNGVETKLKTDDVVSIIPIIHGGINSRIQFKISSSLIELFEIKIDHNSGGKFLEDLRKKFPNLVLQAISSDYILSKTHAKKIIAISLGSKKNNTLLSKKLETDIIMRFAGTTQISYALERIGIKKTKSFFIIAIGRKLSLNALYQHIQQFLISKPFSVDNHDLLKNFFKITNLHLDAIMTKTPLEDLITEKAAILT